MRIEHRTRLKAAMVFVVALASGGCAFMSEVSHIVGDGMHSLGDAFSKEGDRREQRNASEGSGTASEGEPEDASTGEEGSG